MHAYKSVHMHHTYTQTHSGPHQKRTLNHTKNAQMCQALIRLQRQAQVYIPLGPHLVDALARNDLLTTSAKPGQAALDFNANLKVNKNVLSSRTYQDAALKNSIEALMLYAGATAYSAGFPEFVVPIVMQLKLFAKNTQVSPPSPSPLPLLPPSPTPPSP